MNKYLQFLKDEGYKNIKAPTIYVMDWVEVSPGHWELQRVL